MDAAADVRQRRQPTTPHSYSHDVSEAHDMAPPLRSCSPFPSLTSRWRRTRSNAHLLQRSAMRLVEISLLAVAMLVVPSLIQRLVHCIDEIYELLGRRARSHLDVLSSGRVLGGAVLLVVWHVWLVRLAYVAVRDQSDEKKEDEAVSTRKKAATRGTTWGRILGRILLPTYLVLSLVVLFFNLTRRLQAPTFTATTSANPSDAAPRDDLG